LSFVGGGIFTGHILPLLPSISSIQKTHNQTFVVCAFVADHHVNVSVTALYTLTQSCECHWLLKLTVVLQT